MIWNVDIKNAINVHKTRKYVTGVFTKFVKINIGHSIICKSLRFMRQLPGSLVTKRSSYQGVEP